MPLPDMKHSKQPQFGRRRATLAIATLAAVTALATASTAQTQTLTHDRAIDAGDLAFLTGAPGSYGLRYSVKVFNETGAAQDMSVEVHVYVNNVLTDVDVLACGAGGGGGVPSGRGGPAPGPGGTYPPGCGGGSCATPQCIPGGGSYTTVCYSLTVPNNVGFSCICLQEYRGESWFGMAVNTGMPLNSGDQVRVEFVAATGTIGEIDVSNDSAQRTFAPPPVTYCNAKVTSNGCVPSISSIGAPSATAGSGFTVNVVNAMNNKTGLLFYGSLGRLAAPFQGGTLCVRPPLRRTRLLFSGGNPPPSDCSGVFSIDMNAFAVGALGGTPAPFLLAPGTVVNCQIWARDEGYPAPNNTMLSDALEYTVGL